MNSLELTDKDFLTFQKLTFQLLGINLPDSKKNLVISRLNNKIKKLSLASFREYLQHLQSGPNPSEEIQDFINRITTNETSFFREEHHFQFLEEQVFPVFAKSHNPMRIWSSACSSGEEPYSIAITWKRFCQKHNTSFPLKILATDVNTAVLNKAKSGIYSLDEIMKNNSIVDYQKYVEKNDDDFQICKELRSMIAFKQLNLITERFPLKQHVDVIFCRNVMIYFENNVKEQLTKRFYEVLAPNGYLIIGHSENLFAQRDSYKQIGNTIYQKIN